MEIIGFAIFADIMALAFVDTVIAVRVHRTRKVSSVKMGFGMHLLVSFFGILLFSSFERENLSETILNINPFIKASGFLVLLAIIVMSTIELVKEYHLRTTTIAASSVGEGASKVDAGINFVEKDGTAVLTNDRMREISKELFGEDMTYMNTFWEQVLSFGDTIETKRIKFTKDPAFLSKNGRVISFSRNELLGKRREYYEIIANDVTLLFEKSEEIKRINAELEAVEKRLSETYENVASLKQLEELFSYKMKLHDELGNSVLRGTKLLETDVIDLDSLKTYVKHWNEMIDSLKSNNEAAGSTGMNLLGDVRMIAKTLGVGIRVSGKYPMTSELAAMAVREALYNAVRHGKATHIDVACELNGDIYTITISNNGEYPKGDPVEGGGLSGLRKNLENSGGSLNVIWKERVKLVVTIPVEV